MLANPSVFPLVSVLIPVYNAEAYVEEAIRSITTQEYAGSLEIIVLDDASTDSSVARVREIQDARVVIVSSQHNKGIVWQLNRGLAEVKGKYVLRMDADDIALPGRIAQQVAFMEANPEVGACGAAMEVFGSQNFVWQPPVGEGIQVHLLRNSPLAHPTVIMRRQTLQEHALQYREEYLYAEDYKLWAEMSEVSVLANLPIPLLRYRTHPAQTGSLKAQRQQQTADKIRLEQLNRLPWALTTAEKDSIIMLMDSHRTISIPEYELIKQTLMKVYRLNQQQPVFNHLLFTKMLADAWVELLQNVRQFRPQLIKIFLGGRLKPLDTVKFPAGLTAKLLIKSLVSWKTRI